MRENQVKGQSRRAPIRISTRGTMNGESVPRLVEEFFRPLHTVLDYAFAAGVAYGAKHLAGFAWQCWRGVRVYCIPFRRCITSDLSERFGKWAVVLGATSAIGEAFAEELARRGVSVVVISNSYDKLVQLVAKIQLTYNVQAYGIHADFSLGRHVYQEIEEALQGYEIGMLVNCLGIRYDHPQYFILVPSQRLCAILDVNIAATTLMTYLLLPQMIERQRGVVINLCSHVSVLPPSPLRTAYSASMAYMSNFSQSLTYEAAGRGVIVQTLLPCFLAEPHTPPTLFTPHPSTYVSHALSTLGVASITCGYWPHSLQSWVCSWVPRWLWVFVVSYTYRTHRRYSIAQAKEQGTPQFTRRKHSTIAAIPRPPSGRRTSGADLALRRTPSPKRKLSATPAPSIPSHHPAPLKRSPGDPLRVVIRDETAPFPSRTSTSSSIPSPIPESPLTPSSSTPLGGKFTGPHNFPTSLTPLSSSPESTGVATPPRRPSLSLPGATSPTFPRLTLPKRHSRVMVIPSVARYSQQSQGVEPAAAGKPEQPGHGGERDLHGPSHTQE